MYNYEANANKIINEAVRYGIKISINPSTKALFFASSFRGSESVEKSLVKRITHFNNQLVGN